ncbi:MAG: ATP-binding protein [Proteobacteria bacterium]|nr:ATP-binding protein [Pseudomonadota bacterium]
MPGYRIRTRVIVPIGVALALVIAAHVIGVNVVERIQLEQRVDREVANIVEELAHQEDNEAHLLLATLSAIATSRDFSQAFSDRDRETLLGLATPLFEELRASHGITHLYFTEADRTTFLRVHRPDLHGDRITRYTTMQAAQSGRPFVGLDLGLYRALFTLRAVMPWYDDHELIGYLELGKEVVSLTDRLAAYEDVDLLFRLDKRLLERKYWEDGMRVLGRAPDWDKFADWVVIESTIDPLPDLLAAVLDELSSDNSEHGRRIELSMSDRDLIAQSIPIEDATGDKIGELTVLLDTTEAHADALTSIWVLSGVTLFIGFGLFAFFFTFLGDLENRVNERNLLETQLRQSRRGEALSRLVSGIAHSFNNILTGIRGFTDLAIANLDVRERALQNLSEVQVATEDATNLIDRLLAFNREHPMQTVAIDLNELIGRFVSMLERIVGKDIALTFVPDQDVGQVLGDRALLEQVLLELVLNARDAMPDGGEIEVRTKCVTLDDDFKLERSPQHSRYATIMVSDTGTGIPENNLSKVFDPFFTTKEIGQGTGLGLSTVKGIVEQHHGEIIVTSTPGKGSRFVVYLPLQQDMAISSP